MYMLENLKNVQVYRTIRKAHGKKEQEETYGVSVAFKKQLKLQ